MTLFGTNIGYISFVVMLCLMSGGLILYFDVNGYKLTGMNKERKVATFLGIFNISLGALIWVANWVMQLFE